MTEKSSVRPLEGIVVVDLTRVLAGPYCTMLLADLGARVIKIENPGGGDDSRQVGPFVDGESAYFASVNRNKESIALDLKADGDRQILDRLLERADVLVENFRPGVMDKLGLTWKSLREKYPRLIYASISGFGQTGPYKNRPAYDMVVQAMGGLMSITGQLGGEPARVGVSIGDLGAGLYATIGIQSAIIRRTVTGQGARIDISMLDCQVSLLENPIVRYGVTSVTPEPLGTRHPSITPFDMFRTADGYIIIAVGNDVLFQKLCQALDCPQWIDHELFANVPARNQNHEALKTVMEERLSTDTAATWSKILEAAGVPHGPLNSVADLMRDPSVEARKMLVTVPIGEGKSLKMAANPIKIDAFEDNVPLVRRAPRLDEHRAAVLAEYLQEQA